MGAIQQSVNAALNTATTAAAVGKGIASYGKQKEAELKREQAELTKAENERIAGQQSVITEAAELKKEFQDNEKAGVDYDSQIKERENIMAQLDTPFNYGKKDPRYIKANIELEALKEQKRLQQEQFASRMEDLRKRKELNDQKAALYGMKPIDIFNEGGKK